MEQIIASVGDDPGTVRALEVGTPTKKLDRSIEYSITYPERYSFIRGRHLSHITGLTIVTLNCRNIASITVMSPFLMGHGR